MTMEYRRGKPSSRACRRILAVCGLLFCGLGPIWGCGSDTSPTAPTPTQIAGNRAPDLGDAHGNTQDAAAPAQEVRSNV